MNSFLCLILSGVSLASMVYTGDENLGYVSLFFTGCMFICNAIEKGNKK